MISPQGEEAEEEEYLDNAHSSPVIMREESITKETIPCMTQASEWQRKAPQGSLGRYPVYSISKTGKVTKSPN